jgi:HEAT repeat protein
LFEQAVALSGSFRIKEFVGDLIRLLNKQEMTGDDILAKIPVIRALGDIGDPQAVDALRALISSKSILFKNTSDRLKEEIYKTLKNYPYESVKDLVDVGLESKNELIREESSRLKREKAG